MKADKDVNKQLNIQLTKTLTAINQYFLHARILKHWGFGELNEHEYKKSIRDMKDSDILIQRILLLEGLPNLQDINKVRVGEDIPEIISCDLSLEQERHTGLVEAIAHCEEVGDYVSRDILNHLLDENEEQIDWLETQLELIDSMGLEKYSQSQMEIETE
ncbi:bacterioferritin [Brackiella oedipodis]|uniref:bacterioferritin n=1 Tax=Brackiella oedipodis TaxID=124225 RepID=UPI000490CFC0|nr:bacterioferritin [Brackiella oedipodis]